MNIILDEGYSFSLGCFETILVYKNRPIFLQNHIKRLQKALEFLKIEKDINDIKNRITTYINNNDFQNNAIKIMASKENIIITSKENSYTKNQYIQGFTVDLSDIIRNETSPFVYHKTLMYAENIHQKRLFKEQGIDEPIFKNSQGFLCEGATSNIFFIKKEQIYTPRVDSGLLEGILRAYVCDNYDVQEVQVKKEDIYSFDEMFITNSLIGIMPVKKYKDHSFKGMSKSFEIHQKYEEEKKYF